MKILIALFVLISCNFLYPQNVAVQDSLYITPPKVICFYPSGKEVDSLLNCQGEDQSFTEVISDYLYYSVSIISYLKSNNISSELTSSNKFFLHHNNQNVLILDREENKERFGYIFIDKEGKFQILFGVDTDSSLILSIDEFFQLNK